MKRNDFSDLKIEVQNKKEHYFKHEDFIAGTAPFLRGTSSTMFIQKPWELNKKTEGFNTFILDNYSEETIQTLIKLKPNFSFLISENSNITKAIELTSLLEEAHNLISNFIINGAKIDSIAPKISIKLKPGNDLIFDVAKMRATRILWAKMVQQFQPKNQNSLALNIQIESNNFYTSLASVLGGAQNILTTNLISEFIEKETFVSKTIDPLAGSDELERLTQEIISNDWGLFLASKKNEFNDKISFCKSMNSSNLIELALESTEKKSTLEEIYKILKTE